MTTKKNLSGCVPMSFHKATVWEKIDMKVPWRKKLVWNKIRKEYVENLGLNG